MLLLFKELCSRLCHTIIFFNVKDSGTDLSIHELFNNVAHPPLMLDTDFPKLSVRNENDQREYLQHW